MDWIALDWIGLGWIGLNYIGLGWIGLDWVGLDSIRLGWIRIGLGFIESFVKIIFNEINCDFYVFMIIQSSIVHAPSYLYI